WTVAQQDADQLHAGLLHLLEKHWFPPAAFQAHGIRCRRQDQHQDIARHALFRFVDQILAGGHQTGVGVAGNVAAEFEKAGQFARDRRVCGGVCREHGSQSHSTSAYSVTSCRSCLVSACSISSRKPCPESLCTKPASTTSQSSLYVLAPICTVICCAA